MSLNEVTLSRRRRVKKLINKYGDAWIIISPDPNYEYVIGTQPHGFSIAFVTGEKIIGIVGSLEADMMSEYFDEIHVFKQFHDIIYLLSKLISSEKCKKILANFASIKKIYASKLPLHWYKLLESLTRLYDIELISAADFIFELRSIKTEEELKALEDSVKITLDILSEVEPIIKPGVTERFIAAKLYEKLYEYGEPSFKPIVAFGEHTSREHHLPTDKKLRQGEVIYIDVGLKYRGMCSDITRFYVTEKRKEYADAYNAVKAAQDEAIKNAKAGVTGEFLYNIARDTLTKHGYNPELFTHSLGHALGIEVHDIGERLGKKGGKLVPNTCFTVEPALYFKKLEPKWGVRLEDDIIISENTCKRLSTSPEEAPQI